MLLDAIKSLFKSDAADFSEITPEYLEIYRTKYSGSQYIEWLQNKNGKFQAALISKQEMGGNIPPEWNDKIKLVEDAIEQEKNKLT